MATQQNTAGTVTVTQVLNQLNSTIGRRLAEDDAMKSAAFGSAVIPNPPAPVDVIVKGGAPEVNRAFAPRHRFLRVIDPSIPLDMEEELAAGDAQ
jgi:hypothetical protein